MRGATTAYIVGNSNKFKRVSTNGNLPTIDTFDSGLNISGLEIDGGDERPAYRPIQSIRIFIIGFKLYGQGGSSTVNRLNIYNTSTSLLEVQSDLTSQNVAAGDPNDESSATEVLFSFATPHTLAANTTFHFEVLRSGSGVNAMITDQNNESEIFHIDTSGPNTVSENDPVMRVFGQVKS